MCLMTFDTAAPYWVTLHSRSFVIKEIRSPGTKIDVSYCAVYVLYRTVYWSTLWCIFCT